MAAKKTESGDEERYELQKLRPEVDDLCKKFQRVEDSGLADSDDLARISKVLDKINEKINVRISDGSKKREDDELLLLSKRQELAELLPLLKDALHQRMQPAGAERPAAPPAHKLHLPSSVVAAATGCYPCTPRGPSQQQEPEGEEDKGAGAAAHAESVSLKLLHRLAQNVLEPEQYYEWTTSYVDEERLYGWDKEAGDVVDSLIAAPDGERDDDPMFRAAGIAGIHGSGKTALAQKVFVHDKAKDNFAIRLWVCVGPPDSEDRFNLLYRMLDNLGLDTAKVEDDIVAKSNVVRQATEKEVERMKKEGGAEVEELRNKAKEEGRDLDELLREKALQDNSAAVQRSKIGVLLYILHVTLSKTSYLIVFDDIRVYGDDGWYSNLTLPPPPEGEWGDRLAYGLPKWTKHRGAVLVTCRKEDDAKSMVRTGHVFHPPELKGDDAWKLFRREYKQAKKDAAVAANKKTEEDPADDVLLMDLGKMKKQIVPKCLGLPVAIIEAAKGFALLEPLPTTDVPAGDHNDDYALKEEEAAAAGNKPTTREAEDHQTNKDREEEDNEEEHASDGN